MTNWVLVPVEPTDAMISAGIAERHEQAVPEAWSLATSNIYRAMIAARPANSDKLDRVTAALKRQADNMAFVLNHASLPEQWADKFAAELEADRAAIAASERLLMLDAEVQSSQRTISRDDRLIETVVAEAEQACRYVAKHNICNMEEGDYRDGFEVACEVCEKSISDHVARHKDRIAAEVRNSE